MCNTQDDGMSHGLRISARGHTTQKRRQATKRCDARCKPAWQFQEGCIEATSSVVLYDVSREGGKEKDILETKRDEINMQDISHLEPCSDTRVSVFSMCRRQGRRRTLEARDF